MTPEELAEIQESSDSGSAFWDDPIGDARRLLVEVRAQAARITELEAENVGLIKQRARQRGEMDDLLVEVLGKGFEQQERAERAEAALADLRAES